MRKIFTLFILLLLLPVTAVAQDDNHDNHEGWTALTNEVLSGNTLPAGKYYLSDDLKCNGPAQTWITISGGEVTLCLNGHVLNLNGQSLRVENGATFHLCDCNSTNQTHKFTVDNGLWQLDEADGTETLTGGVITGGKNRKEDISGWNGGGVSVNGTFTMSGAPIVMGNKKRNDSNSNIYLYSSITIGEGGLTEGAKLGVTPVNNTVIKDWNSEWGNPAEYFTSDNSDYGVGLDDQGNVVLASTGTQYAVVLNTNEGMIAEGKNITSYTFGTGTKLPTEITKTGYTFAGWYEKEDLSGDPETEIPSYAVGDKRYWAKWTANSYTVGFNANGGDGTMTNQSFTYDVVQALSANAFTRTGYTFTGWNTTAEGTGTSYEDEKEVSNLTPTANATVTLYAQWKINSYKITFVNDDGTELQSNMVEYNSTPVFTGTIPTKASTDEYDYTFAGWTPTITAVTGDATYTATYTATTRSYTITVQVADGCDGMGEVTGGGTYGYGETTTLTATAKSGYRFVKWEDGEAAATREITVTGDATYTALFEQVEKPKPDPISYYNIYVEDVCDGVKIIPSKQVVREGGSINVYVEKDTARYTFDNFKVYYKRSYYGTWDELKEGTQPGEYPIKNIWTHIYIKAEGAEEKEDPTGIESIEGVKVYTKDGSLYVQTPQREQVIIVSMSGAVVKSEEQVGLKQYHGLQPGIYIVRVGDRAYKVRLN